MSSQNIQNHKQISRIYKRFHVSAWTADEKFNNKTSWLNGHAIYSMYRIVTYIFEVPESTFKMFYEVQMVLHSIQDSQAYLSLNQHVFVQQSRGKRMSTQLTELSPWFFHTIFGHNPLRTTISSLWQIKLNVIWLDFSHDHHWQWNFHVLKSLWHMSSSYRWNSTSKLLHWNLYTSDKNWNMIAILSFKIFQNNSDVIYNKYPDPLSNYVACQCFPDPLWIPSLFTWNFVHLHANQCKSYKPLTFWQEAEFAFE